jgi:hypothetical protein
MSVHRAMPSRAPSPVDRLSAKRDPAAMPRLAAVCPLAFACVHAVAQTPTVTASGEMMRLGTPSVVAAAGGAWTVTLPVANDNNNAALPSSFRRWWHCEIANLPPGGATLNISVTNAGYTDVILPTWSLSTDGVTFGPYNRVPTTAVPTLVGSTTHRFTLVTPPGVPRLRLAKYFPYSVTRKDAWLQSVASHPRVRSVTTIGNSVQGRPIQLLTLTDNGVPDAGKKRVWIHSAVHPSETPAYFFVEGLVAWLQGGSAEAERLLDAAIVDIVPMANPDGVFLGNYRTNANSVNLENEWSAPYSSTAAEVVALRTAIEARMGTVAAPAANPIRVLLNLHASHGVGAPFHFQHVANANWNATTNNTGVIPLVNADEGAWIAAFKARSPFVNLGATQSSALTSRPFVESMCHDRWTAVNGWLNAPGFRDPVMAITWEGTYRRGPDGVTWDTEADYRTVGMQAGLALFDFLGLQLTASLTPYGSPCASLSLAGALTPQLSGGHFASLQIAGAVPSALGLLAVGSQQLAVPLPSPWQACTLLGNAEVTLSFVATPAGAASFGFLVPPTPGLDAFLQAFAIDWTQPSLPLDASRGLRLRNDY